MLGGELANALEVARLRRHDADVELDRLDDDRRDLVGWASRIAARMSGSLNGAITVSAIRERGMPALAGTVVGRLGRPHRSRGGWMLTSTSSWWPW